MYHTNSSTGNTSLVISRYLGVARITEIAGKHILLTRNDGQQAYHWAHEFTPVTVNDAVTFTRGGVTLVGLVVAVDTDAGELELLLENGEQGWADAHAVKTVLARGMAALAS